MGLSEHDTIDLEEELGDIDAVLAEGSLEVAARARRAGFVELFLIGIANTIWAVVGAVLWLPQALRAVLTAALRIIHSALTHQSPGRAIAGIRRVSRAYVDRFLTRRSEQVFVGRRHELRPFRLVGEVLWAAAFYLLLLRWLAPNYFEPVWRRILGAWEIAREAGVQSVSVGRELLTTGVESLGGARLQVGGTLLGVAVVGVLLGFWLGRRGR